MASVVSLSTISSTATPDKEEDTLLMQDITEETDGDQLSSVPPLVIISTRVKQYSGLVRLANPGVALVVYDYDATTLSRLLQLIGDKLKGRKALSIAMVVHGQPGHFKINRHNMVTFASLKEDRNLQHFFQDLVSSFLHVSGELARLDILNCPVEQNSEGKQLISALKDIVNVPVSSSDDIYGVEVHQEQIGTLYFDGRKLKEWKMPTVQKLDMYEKIRVVGKGAYGEAILYRRKEDDSQVILKQINILELNKTERQNVVNEIKILSMLDHPHIVSYYDNFEEDGLMMIEMEFAEGGSLQQFLKQRHNTFLSELEVLTKFSQMVDAINFIHKNNILHRDLKTANVFLTRDGLVKLGDFGISKLLSATHQAAQTVVGTPYYISPEIVCFFTQ
jgi:NIMA (never in mitosis gene a)-related kinase